MKIYSILIILLLNISNVYSQFSRSFLLNDNKFLFNSNTFFADENSDTLKMDKKSYFFFGIPVLSYEFPQVHALEAFSQTGVLIGSRKNNSNIDEINFDNNVLLTFNIGSENTFGFFMNQFNYKNSDNTVDTVQHYSGILNLYGTNVNSEIIVRLPLINRRIIGGISLTFFNLGATGTYIKGGKFDKKFIGALDVVPLYIQLYGKIAFKNASFGIGAFINPSSFVEYRFGTKELLKDGNGIFMNSSNYNKYALTFYIHFK